MKRIAELDALRGVAAVVIVVYHLWLIRYAALGTAVDLFFVMSGYLITSIILKQREQTGFLTRFYARRALRIWPIYYLSLIVFLLVNRFLPAPQATDALPYYLTYTQRLACYVFAEPAPFSKAFDHAWSLAIEEQFYLIWPFVLVAFGGRVVLPLSAGLVVVAAAARIVGFDPWIMLTRCDGLAAGAGLAAALERIVGNGSKSRRATIRLLALGACAVGFIAAEQSVFRSLGLDDQVEVRRSLRRTALNLAYAALVGLAALRSGTPLLAPLRARPLVYLGQISYGLYLYHAIVFHLLDDHATVLGLTNPRVLDVLKLVLGFGLAALSWKYVEAPLLKLKRHFEPREADTAHGAAVKSGSTPKRIEAREWETSGQPFDRPADAVPTCPKAGPRVRKPLTTT